MKPKQQGASGHWCCHHSTLAQVQLSIVDDFLAQLYKGEGDLKAISMTANSSWKKSYQSRRLFSEKPVFKASSSLKRKKIQGFGHGRTIFTTFL